jgi:hypothetical protein
MKRWAWILGLLFATSAFAQNNNPTGPAKGLTFGPTSFYNSQTVPLNAQCLAISGTKIIGTTCGGGGGGGFTSTGIGLTSSGTIVSLAPDAILPSLPSTGAATVAQMFNATSITINKPASVVAGHTMIMGYGIQVTGTVTPPTGWTLIRADPVCNGTSGFNIYVGSFYKVAGGSEPSSYTFTTPTTYGTAGIIDMGTGLVDTISATPICVAPGVNFPTVTPGINAENVVAFAANADGGNATGYPGLIGTTLRIAQPVAGDVGISFGTTPANYPTGPTITAGWVDGVPPSKVGAQVIAMNSGSVYSARAILQGDSYGEVTKLRGTVGGNDSIDNFNIDGRFNVKNPVYGARGDDLTDDTASIQSAFNAACAWAVARQRAATLWFPDGEYMTTFPIISNCASPVNFKGESENSAIIMAETGALFPVVMHEGSNYLSGMNTAAGGSVFGTALATGAGGAMVWGSGSFQFYDLEDAWQGTAAYPLSGAGAFSVEGFFNYTGGAIGGNGIYLFDSTGDDLNLGASNAVSMYLVTGNYPEACITTTGSGHVCTTNNTHAITPSTIYEFQWSYDGSNLRLFYGIPGNTTTLAGSVAATGTIIQKPSEVFALGDGGSGFLMTGENLQGNAHWIGSLDSIRLSTVARNNTTYTAPTTKFTSDTNTLLLLNNENQKDVFDQASFVKSLGSFNAGAPPVWMPLHSNALAGGNTHGGFYNISMQAGSYSLLGICVLYTTIDHVNAGGATHYGVKIFNNSYGTRIEHLTVATQPYAQSGLTMSNNAGLAKLDWIFQTGSYYGMQLVDSGGMYQQLYLNPGASQVAAIDLGGTSVFHSYEIGEPDVDFESGGTQTPIKLWGLGNYQFQGGDFQPGANNVADIAPAGLTATFTGGNIVPSGTPPIFHFEGAGAPASPITWINPTLTGASLATYVAAGGSLSDVPKYAVAVPNLPFTLSGATPLLSDVSGGDTDPETYTETVTAATTPGIFTVANAPVDTKIFHWRFTQGSGGSLVWPCTSGTCAWGASGINLNFPITGGCLNMPVLPSTTGNSLLLAALFTNAPSTPQINIVSCEASGP